MCGCLARVVERGLRSTLYANAEVVGAARVRRTAGVWSVDYLQSRVVAPATLMLEVTTAVTIARAVRPAVEAARGGGSPLPHLLYEACEIALAVAELVAQGRVGRGILIDGAGIRSCMAANKVPGVRAAMCYDHATALNSREHNDANVLTLGAGLVGESLARQIVQTWLASPFGAGRHARRVDKIMAIERRFTAPR